MLPKKYFENNKLPVDYNYVFVLLKEEFIPTYEEYIKKPLGDNKLKCESAFDIQSPGEIMSDLWARIQQAHVVIIDISGFTPNLMYELGVVLTVKERVIVICDETQSSTDNLPFNIGHVRVLSFDPSKLEAFSHQLIYQVNEIASEGRDITSPEFLVEGVKDWIETAKNLREANTSSALQLIESADEEEPDHWYIYMEWGVTLTMGNKLELGIEKLEQALSLAKFNPQQALVLQQIAWIHQQHKNYDRADGFFRKAEDKNARKPELYVSWAKLHEDRGDFNDAIRTISKAIELSDKDAYKKRLAYYTERMLNPTSKLSFEDWIKQRGKKKAKPVNTSVDFRRFTQENRPGSTVQGRVEHVHPTIGVFVELYPGFSGLIKRRDLPPNYYEHGVFEKGQSIPVILRYIHYDTQRIDLTCN